MVGDATLPWARTYIIIFSLSLLVLIQYHLSSIINNPSDIAHLSRKKERKKDGPIIFPAAHVHLYMYAKGGSV